MRAGEVGFGEAGCVFEVLGGFGDIVFGWEEEGGGRLNY